MKRRLMLLNFVLLAMVVIAGATLKKRWSEARTHEREILQKKLLETPAPPLTPLKPVEPAKPANYIDVASHMLLARDRNPNIIYDPPPPPPPPKPMPPLPRAFGIVDLGEGPTALLSEKAGAPSKPYRAGDRIGEFKLIAMTSAELMFDWEGKRFVKSLQELVDRGAPPPEAPSAPVSAAQQTSAAAPQTKPGPGASVGGEYRACTPGDSSPNGAVVDGMRKVESVSPFGKSCRWEPVK